MDVQVTTAAGSSPDTSVDDFTYVVPPTRYEQTDERIVEVGNWADFSAPAASEGSYGRANTADASATIYFTGTRFDWIAMKGTTPGLADVYLDGVKQTTIDLRAPSAVYDELVWSTGPISDGLHKVEIRRSPLNTGSEYVTLDAVDILGTLMEAPVPPAAITGLDPTSGSTAGGTSVTITGTGFTDATSVTFAGLDAAHFTVDSATRITAISPAHGAGTIDVRVTTGAGPSGNTAADDFTYIEPPHSTRYEQIDTHIQKAGTWKDYARTEASAGSYGRSLTGGASATVYFKGTRLDWIAMKGTTTGIAEVYVDGVWKARVDLRATSASYQLMAFSTGTLPAGDHSLKIVRSPACPTGKYVTVDAVDIWGTISDPPIRYEQADTHIAKVGSWTNFTKTAASGGSYGRSLTSTPAAASATIYFTGSRLDWIAMKGTTAGSADVYLDGNLVTTINLNATTATYNLVVWSTGTLLEGDHWVRLVRNPAGGTPGYLTLDAVEIWGDHQDPAVESGAPGLPGPAPISSRPAWRSMDARTRSAMRELFHVRSVLRRRPECRARVRCGARYHDRRSVLLSHSPILPHRQRNEDDEDRRHPSQQLPYPVPSRLSAEERPSGVDSDGYRLVVGPHLQPSGHRCYRDEGGAREHQREYWDESRELSRLRVFHGQADGGEHPGERVSEEQHEDHAQGVGGGTALETKADQGAHGEHEGHNEHVAGQIGEGPSGEYSRAGHGECPHPIDDPAFDVGG